MECLPSTWVWSSLWGYWRVMWPLRSTRQWVVLGQWGVCPQREFWDSSFLAILEGSKHSTAISYLHSHQPKTTGCNGHRLKLRNCELIMNFFSNWDLTHSVTVLESWLTPLGFGILSLGKAQLRSGWLLKWAARFPWFHAAPLCSANNAHGNAVAARQTSMTYRIWAAALKSWTLILAPPHRIIRLW